MAASDASDSPPMIVTLWYLTIRLLGAQRPRQGAASDVGSPQKREGTPTTDSLSDPVSVAASAKLGKVMDLCVGAPSGASGWRQRDGGGWSRVRIKHH